jgi:hypothetical protein
MRNIFTEDTKLIIHNAERLLHIKTPFHGDILETVGINNWKEFGN